MFAWDETAFLELFGVAPRVDTSPGAHVVRNAGAFVEIGGAGSWPHARGHDMQQPLEHGLRVFVSPALMVKTFGP